eukprot:1961279-Pleurochrysis_carterae.AAC.3
MEGTAGMPVLTYPRYMAITDKQVATQPRYCMVGMEKASATTPKTRRELPFVCRAPAARCLPARCTATSTVTAFALPAKNTPLMQTRGPLAETEAALTECKARDTRSACCQGRLLPKALSRRSANRHSAAKRDAGGCAWTRHTRLVCRYIPVSCAATRLRRLAQAKAQATSHSSILCYILIHISRAVEANALLQLVLCCAT